MSTSPKGPASRHRHAARALEELAGIMETLRHSCPWDKEQNLASLRSYLIEECYELIEALDADDPVAHQEELGDLLFQIVFQAEIRHEEGKFDLAAAITDISQKLRRRHPHVFGDARVKDAAEVKKNWEAIKAQEKQRKSVLEGIPAGLPPLARAQKLGKRAASVGFDWPEARGAWNKIQEELAELEQAQSQQHVHHEIGDVLFSLVNFARHLRIDADKALSDANRRFETRFKHAEMAAKSEGKEFAKLDVDLQERLWIKAKAALRGEPGGH